MNRCKLKRKSTLMPLALASVEGIFVYEIKRFKKLLFICIIALCLFSFHSASFANSAPALDSITPSSGQSIPDTAVQFTAIYKDSDGWQNLKEAYLLIYHVREDQDALSIGVSTSINGKNCCYLYYNQNSNKLYLRNDANTGWLGGRIPGSSYVMKNSYAKLDCSKTKVTGSGSMMTVKWNVTFKPLFAGTTAKKICLYIRDDANASQGWIQKGTWTVLVEEEPVIDITEPLSGAVMNAEP